MTNWTTNRLRLRGSAEDVARFQKRAISGREPLSFERFAPIPKALCETNCNWLSVYYALFGNEAQQNEYAYARPDADSDDPADLVAAFAKRSHLQLDEAEALIRLYGENRFTYGHEGWLPWVLHYWSTRRDAAEVHVDSDGETGDVIYEYESASVPPLGALKAMADAFPSLELRNEFWDECQAYHGVFVLRDGRLCRDESRWTDCTGEELPQSDDMEGGAA